MAEQVDMVLRACDAPAAFNEPYGAHYLYLGVFPTVLKIGTTSGIHARLVQLQSGRAERMDRAYFARLPRSVAEQHEVAIRNQFGRPGASAARRLEWIDTEHLDAVIAALALAASSVADADIAA